MSHHRGEYFQRGRGLGSFFRAIIRTVLPIISSVGSKVVKSPITKNLIKTAKRSAIDAGLNVASDVLEGKNLGESLKSNLVTAVSRVADSATAGPSPRKYKKTTTTVNKKKIGGKRRQNVSRRKKKNTTSIFD